MNQQVIASMLTVRKLSITTDPGTGRVTVKASPHYLAGPALAAANAQHLALAAARGGAESLAPIWQALGQS